ncbi:MAG: DNA-binding response regulator [Alphaproteobacteria bacterium]|nr:DNA-binding response regulator [Alphaproteobacteria bacterium]
MESKTLVITHSNFFADFIKNLIPGKNIFFHLVLNKGQNIKKKIVECNPAIIILHLANYEFLDKEKIFAIHKEFKTIKLLIIGPKNPNYIEYFIKNGASAYLYEDATADELLTNYKNIKENKIIFSDKIAQILLKKTAYPDANLTIKENRVLDLIKIGCNPDEIGLKLDCSSQTVNVHKFNIRIKLNLKKNSELLRYALQS